MADIDKRYRSAEELGRDLDVLIAAEDPNAVKPADLPSVTGDAHGPAVPGWKRRRTLRTITMPIASPRSVSPPRCEGLGRVTRAFAAAREHRRARREEPAANETTRDSRDSRRGGMPRRFAASVDEESSRLSAYSWCSEGSLEGSWNSAPRAESRLATSRLTETARAMLACWTPCSKERQRPPPHPSGGDPSTAPSSNGSRISTQVTTCSSSPIPRCRDPTGSREGRVPHPRTPTRTGWIHRATMPRRSRQRRAPRRCDHQRSINARLARRKDSA